VGEEARDVVGEAEEERRRNLAHNAKVLRLFAELALKTTETTGGPTSTSSTTSTATSGGGLRRTPSSGKPT